MPPTIVTPRKRFSTLLTLIRPVTGMTTHMISMMKAPRKLLPTQIARPVPRRRSPRLQMKRQGLIRDLRMEKPSVFL